MMRRYLYILSGIVIIVVIMMAFLYFSTNNPRDKKNGFNRTELQELVKLQEVSGPITDIAGIHNNKCYLVTNRPDRLLILDISLHELALNILVTDKLRSNFTTTLLSNTLYIAGHNVPGIIQYDLTTKDTQVFNADRTFSRFALVNDHSAILRGFNASFDDELFRKMDMSRATYAEEKGITDKTEGGGFVTDGMLNYDTKTGRLVYNFFYSNRLLFMDTSLNLVYTGHTIDTFHTYTASARSVKTSEGIQFTFTKPPQLLSLHSCVSDGKLFIYSRLKADNKEPANHSVIDIYDIASATYQGSLYIPPDNNKKMLKFRVFDNRLYAIYPNKLIIFKI